MTGYGTSSAGRRRHSRRSPDAAGADTAGNGVSLRHHWIRRIPPGTWATDIELSAALAELLDSCPSAPRVAVLTDDEPAARVRSIAPLLWEAGVRYFAGVRDWRPGKTRALGVHRRYARLPRARLRPCPDSYCQGPMRWPVTGGWSRRPVARDMHGQPAPLILLVRHRRPGSAAGPPAPGWPPFPPALLNSS